MKATAPHLLLSDTNPKLAFYFASSFSQTAIPGVIFIDIKTEGIDPIGFNSDESVIRTQPKLKVKCRDSKKSQLEDENLYLPKVNYSGTEENLLIDACVFFFFKICNHLNFWVLG